MRERERALGPWRNQFKWLSVDVIDFHFTRLSRKMHRGPDLFSLIPPLRKASAPPLIQQQKQRQRHRRADDDEIGREQLFSAFRSSRSLACTPVPASITSPYSSRVNSLRSLHPMRGTCATRASQSTRFTRVLLRKSSKNMR